MASNLTTPSVEQCCIIKFLMKEKVKPAKILCRLNAHSVGKRPCPVWISVIGTMSFPKAIKKSQIYHMLKFSHPLYATWTLSCQRDDFGKWVNWVHYFSPESKWSSMEWHHKGSPPPKNFKTQLARSWQVGFGIQNGDSCWFSSNRITINAQYYSNLVHSDVYQTFRKNTHGKLSTIVILLHGNAHPHTENWPREHWLQWAGT
jgi:hypothetical protein